MLNQNNDYICSIFLIIGLYILYLQYKKISKTFNINKNKQETDDYDLIKKYLLNDSSLAKSKKNIIWIHNTYDINARSWLNFQSRNTRELNQPYLYLTIKSIIDKCGNDFNICLIDDNSFFNILHGWTIDLTQVGEPIRSKIRDLALAKIIYTYGGLLVPPSFICLQNLNSCYIYNTMNDKMVVGERINKTVSAVNTAYAPSNKFMGCLRDCGVMKEYMNYLEILVSKDFTDESNFLGSINNWLSLKIENREINIVPSNKLGAKDAMGNSVMIERLISNNYIDFINCIYGIYIPADDVLTRLKYNWFARLSPEQVLESDTTIGKQLLIAQ